MGEEELRRPAVGGIRAVGFLPRPPNRLPNLEQAVRRRVRSAVNFVKAIEGSEAPLNTPDQALKLMQIIDGAYQSAATGRPVSF